MTPELRLMGVLSVSGEKLLRYSGEAHVLSRDGKPLDKYSILDARNAALNALAAIDQYQRATSQNVIPLRGEAPTILANGGGYEM